MTEAGYIGHVLRRERILTLLATSEVIPGVKASGNWQHGGERRTILHHDLEGPRLIGP